VVATESYQLFAYRASSIGLPLALLGVADHPLHLVAAGKSAVGVPTLAGVHQALNTPLYAQLSGLLWVASWGNFSTTTIQVETKLLHFVRVTILLVASNTEVKVITDSTVVACFY